MERVIELTGKFEKSRKNLLAVFILSTVNIFLFLFNATISFPFSAAIPTILVGVGQFITQDTGSNSFFVFGAIMAFIVVASYGIFYLLSKKYSAFMLVALIFFVPDTLLVVFFLISEFEIGFVIDFLFHIWVMVSLASGVKALSELKKMPIENIQQALESLQVKEVVQEQQQTAPMQEDEEKNAEDN